MWITYVEFFRTEVLVDNTPELSPKPSSQRRCNSSYHPDKPYPQPTQPRTLAKEEWRQQQSCEQTAQVPPHGDVLRHEAVGNVCYDQDDGRAQV